MLTSWFATCVGSSSSISIFIFMGPLSASASRDFRVAVTAERG
jgi:hypothetical protein